MTLTYSTLRFLSKSTAGLRCSMRIPHRCIFSSARPGFQKVVENGSNTQSTEDQPLLDQYKKVMGKVPQPVVVVTSVLTSEDSVLKRGVTCSSFTSVSLKPPIVSFCMNRPSRMHNILLKTGYFAVHVLAQDQVRYGVHFSKPVSDDNDQFQKVPHKDGIQGLPIIQDSKAVLQCEAHSVHTVGDHYVWYGEVLAAESSPTTKEPLLYYARSYRSIGDETFMQAFEDTTLPFEDWTHEAHIRMAWNYIRELGREGATPHIKKGIQKYNEQNKEKVGRGYHETVTMFYIHMIADAMQRCDHPDMTFDEFSNQNQYLRDRDLIFRYYSHRTIEHLSSKSSFQLPDKQPLP